MFLKAGTSGIINWDELKKLIAERSVVSIQISNDGRTARVKTSSGYKIIHIPNEDRFVEKLEGFQADFGIPVLDYVPILHRPPDFFISLVGSVFTLLLITGAVVYVRGKFAGGMGGGGGPVSIFISEKFIKYHMYIHI